MIRVSLRGIQEAHARLVIMTGELHNVSSFQPVRPGASLIVAWRVQSKHILVIGGGEVGTGRVFCALESGARVTLVSPSASPELQYRAHAQEITWIPRKFVETDLDDADMVFSTLDDVDVSLEVANLCRSRRIPVNVADKPSMCDFWFMSQHRDRSLQVAVSTNGHGPKLANIVRRKIADALPKETGAAIERVGALRKMVRQQDPAQSSVSRRMTWMSKVCEHWSLSQLATLDQEAMDKLMEWYHQDKDPLPSWLHSDAIEYEGRTTSSDCGDSAVGTIDDSSSDGGSSSKDDLVTAFDAMSAKTSHDFPTPSTKTIPAKTTSPIFSPSLLYNHLKPYVQETVQTFSVSLQQHLAQLSYPHIMETFFGGSKTKVIEGKKSPKGSIALVGVGPGDPKLLTVAALEAVKGAEVALVDSIVPDEIRALIPEGITIEYSRKVTKKGRANADAAQGDLNDVGLEAARKGKRVVRLKCGDPFLFGRGGEEVLFYRQNGFEPQVIPGISSALAAPLVAGVPVTHRGVANELLVMTGQLKGGVTAKLPQFAPQRTIVVLMGMKHIRQMMHEMKDSLGYPAALPVAVVQCATHSSERSALGTVETIADLVETQKISAPATIVIGAVGDVLNKQCVKDERNEEGAAAPCSSPLAPLAPSSVASVEVGPAR